MMFADSAVAQPFCIQAKRLRVSVESWTESENALQYRTSFMETKMSQFDNQFIIVIFLTLLCTQRIFGYDLSLLKVRGILRWIHNLIVPLFRCHMKKEICWSVHFIFAQLEQFSLSCAAPHSIEEEIQYFFPFC